MNTANLISKLTKMNVAYTVVDVNGYNMDIEFSINGLNFSAGFNTSKNIIEDFSRAICYDNVNQEMQRRFFTNFNKLISYANA